MLVCITFFWFFLYSVFGWIYESTYCTVTERKWMNRGFLYGPYCPIYGVGIVLIMALWYFTELNPESASLQWWQIFLVSFFGSAVLEYATHWTLEKLFHACWWDYSNMPLNINGRICLPASVFFGLGGLFVIYVLYDPTYVATKSMDPLVIEAFALLFVATISADTAITVSALQAFAEKASSLNRSLNEHMDNLVAEAVLLGDTQAAAFAERREGAAQAFAEKRDQARELFSPTKVTALKDEAEATLEAEREAYAAILRDRTLGSMSHSVRSAARRAKNFSVGRDVPKASGGEQFSQMLRDVREKHWPKSENRSEVPED